MYIYIHMYYLLFLGLILQLEVFFHLCVHNIDYYDDYCDSNMTIIMIKMVMIVIVIIMMVMYT
jgi:hypothetical protein